VLLNLKDPSAAEVLHRLVATCDVFAASVRYDGLTRLGFDYEAVKAIRPISSMCTEPATAPTALCGEPAYDDLIQSASGLADLLPRVDGDPTPRLIPTLVADKVSGLFMAQAITAALSTAEDGRGQFVEVPMLECITSFTLAEHLFGHV